MKENIDYIGALILLKYLVRCGLITQKDSAKIADCIAVSTGADIIVDMDKLS